MGITDGEDYHNLAEFERDEANAIDSLRVTFNPRQRLYELAIAEYDEFADYGPDPDEWYDRYRDERDSQNG